MWRITQFLYNKLNKLESFSRGVDYDHFLNIYFRSDVTMPSVTKITRIVMTINNNAQNMKKKELKKFPIKLHITSLGGEVIPGLMCYDILNKSRLPIYIHGEGQICSAATLIFMAGHKRYMTEHSKMLIHQLSSGVSGSFQKITDNRYNCQMLMDDIKKIYLDNSHISESELNDLLNKNIYLSSKECLKYGFIDKIL